MHARHSHAQEMNPPPPPPPPKKPKTNATQVGCLAKALEGKVCLCGTIEEQHLFCCDVHNLNRERSVESEERVSGERVGKTGGERQGGWERERDQVKRTKWEGTRETDLCVCECVCVCVYIYMGGTNLREEKGALRVLSTPFSSSHSWEIWSTELGGTNTQTQINCCLENKSSFPFISLRCSISPSWSSGSKHCCVNGARFQTLEHEKNSFHGEKRETNETHLLISILVFH